MKNAAMVMTVTALLLVALAAPAAAFQRPGHPPNTEVQARFGYFFLSDDGEFWNEDDDDFWDETQDVFTLDGSDFDDFVLGFTYVHSVSNYVEFGANADFYHQIERSEYRNYVDMYGDPIFHDTELAIVPMTVDVRFLLGGRYRLRPEGRFLPKPVFYVGLGGGLTFWEYEEYGEFIAFAPDPDDDEIIRDRFTDDGVALELHALVGLEVPLSRSVNLVFEGRYSTADDELGGDFSDLDQRKIYLGGTSFFGGVSFRF